MSRRFERGVFLIALLSSLSSCKKTETVTPASQPPSPQVRTIAVAAIWETTGDLSKLGSPALKATQLAYEHYQSSKRGPMVNLEVQDTQSTPQGAASAFQAASVRAKPIAVIGPLTSAAAMTVAPLAEREHVVLMTVASTPALTTAGPFTFRTYPSDSYEAAVMARYILAHDQHRRVSVVYPQNDYGAGLAEAFRKAVGTQLQILQFEAYPEKGAEFRAIAHRVLAATPEIIYAPGYPVGVGPLAKSLRSAGFKGQIYSSLGIEDPSLFTYAGSAADGIRYTVTALPDATQNPKRATFEEEYRKRFGEEASFPALYGYDTASVVFDSIAAGASTAKELQTAFGPGKSFSGVTGSFTFDENGDVVRDYAIKRVERSKFVADTAVGKTPR